MGINRTDHIVYGWKLPYNIKNDKDEIINFWEDKYRPMIEGHLDEEFTIIRDDMCGNYTVFGLSVDNSESWNFVKLNIKNNDTERVKNKYKELFGNDNIIEPHLFIFSQYS